jgi:lysophospholipase L1-like esterase
MKFLSISLLSLFISASFLPAAQSLLPDVKRILILGDSITHSGQYIGFLETVLIADTDRRYEIIGSGLSSETVSGLSEEGHAGGKFPRPDLHERLGRVLDTTKPELVLASYGMNCGIYQPMDEGRFQKYKEGIQFLRDKAKDVGARVIHLTPPVYDPIQKKGEAPFYNDVLGAYGKWLMEQKSGGWTVIDIHEPMNEALAGLRKSDPSAYLSKDGVHPGWAGQVIMARAFLKAMGLNGNLGEISWDAISDKSSASGGHEIVACAGGKLKIRSTKLPFSVGEGDAKNDNSIRAGLALVPFDQELNRFTLRVTSPKAKAYKVTWGTESKQYTAEQLLAGVPLATDFIKHPLLPAFQNVWKAVLEKQSYETKQIKSIVHGKQGKDNPDAAFAETEPIRAPLAEKVKTSLQPVEHEIVITPVD